MNPTRQRMRGLQTPKARMTARNFGTIHASYVEAHAAAYFIDPEQQGRAEECAEGEARVFEAGRWTDGHTVSASAVPGLLAHRACCAASSSDSARLACAITIRRSSSSLCKRRRPASPRSRWSEVAQRLVQLFECLMLMCLSCSGRQERRAEGYQL